MVQQRLFWRSQRENDPPRAYANFRDYTDVGGRRAEALIPEGHTRATTNPDLAIKLLADRLSMYEDRRRAKTLTGRSSFSTLLEYGSYHLDKLAGERNLTPEWLAYTEQVIERAVEFWGAGRDIRDITPEDLTKFWGWLERKLQGRSGKPVSGGTIRHHLNCLSAMYRRAVSERYAERNPVHDMYDKPNAATNESEWLEMPLATGVLAAAKDYEPERSDGLQFVYALVATFLLTGARQDEVFGLEWQDLLFDRKLVVIRPNNWRRLKTQASQRPIPMWPQLEAILLEHQEEEQKTGLVFPSKVRGKTQMITDIRKILDKLANTVECETWPWLYSNGNRKLRTKMFRHTYCAARLQTLDGGAPVSVYTVSREMGHSSTDMVSRVYGHLGEIRQRKPVVEYL